MYAVFVLILLKTLYRAANIFFSIERIYVPLRQHLGWTNKVLVGHHHHHVHNANYKSLFSVEPSVSEEILLENNNITVSCKQICPQALHFYQKLQAKRINFRPTNFKNLCSWLATTWQGGHIGGVSEIITIECFFEEFTWKWGLVPAGEKLFLTLTHHKYGFCDVKCKLAIVIHFNLLQVSLSEPPFVIVLLFIPSSTVVSGYFYVSDNIVAISSV